MGKKKREEDDYTEPEERGCLTCAEALGRLDDDFPCSRAQVVVERGRLRVNCKHWVSQAAIN